MGTYVDRNRIQPGEGIEPRSEPEALIAVPASCLKLVKAVELFYHAMPDHEIRNCFPKDVPTRGYAARFFDKKIRDHASSISRATLDRGFVLACTIVEEAMKNADFYNTMGQDTEGQRVKSINDLIEPHHMFYLFRDQFKSVSFAFIFHKGERPIPAEEKLRKDLRMLLRYTTSLMIYGFLRYCIRAEEGKEDTPITRIGAGRAAVVANYRAIPYHGSGRDIVKSLRRLPASPDFEGMARRQAGLGDKSGGKGVSGGKRKKGTDGEEEEDDRGIVGKRQRVGDE